MQNEPADVDRVARLTEFLGEWRALGNRVALDADRLAAFLKAAGHYLHVPQATPPVAARPEPDTFEPKLAKLHEALNSARSIGFGFNPWAVVRLQRDEVRTCAVLAALWDPAMCGDAAVTFLKAFVSQLTGEDLPTDGELDQRYTVRTERYLLGDRSTRMDITVEGQCFIMVIEAKIDALEGSGAETNDNASSMTSQFARIPDVTKAYATTRDRMRGFVVLLAPRRPNTDFNGIYIDWRSVARAAQQCLPPKRADYSFHHKLLADFARHVITF